MRNRLNETCHFRWLRAGLQCLFFWHTGDTAVLHRAIDLLSLPVFTDDRESIKQFTTPVHTFFSVYSYYHLYAYFVILVHCYVQMLWENNRLFNARLHYFQFASKWRYCSLVLNRRNDVTATNMYPYYYRLLSSRIMGWYYCTTKWITQLGWFDS